jgi:ABC-type phosphate transport system auxiliary subunit
MKPSRKVYLVIGILIVIITVAAWYFYPAPVVYNESFEKILAGGWRMLTFL